MTREIDRRERHASRERRRAKQAPGECERESHPEVIRKNTVEWEEMDDTALERANAVAETAGVYLLVGALVWGLAGFTTAFVDLLFVAPGSPDPWETVLPAMLPALGERALTVLWVGTGTGTAVVLDRWTAVDLTGSHERRRQVVLTGLGIIFVVTTTVVLGLLWRLGLFG